HPAIAIQVLNAGHLLANHTYHHVKAWHLSPQKYLLEVRHCQAVLENITGEQRTTRLFRPPHGQLTRAHVRMLAPEFQVVMWSSLSYDFDVSLSPEKCLQKTISSIKPGSIVVLHDSLKAERNLRYVLPRLLHHYAGLGYSFNAL
ncbi:MAG: polysaccharide deacetylase family protein, partial [Rufibacter sp.]